MSTKSGRITDDSDDFFVSVSRTTMQTTADDRTVRHDQNVIGSQTMRLTLGFFKR
jgi:hypothetical protein